jgi:hypothetical protein
LKEDGEKALGGNVVSPDGRIISFTGMPTF